MSTKTILYIIITVALFASVVTSGYAAFLYYIKKRAEQDIQNAIEELKKRETEVKVDDYE